MDKIIWIVFALIAGVFLPIQGGLNTRLGKDLESPVYASLVSFVVGALALIFYILLTKQTMAAGGWRTAPGYVWIGGFLGAFYVTVIILAFPRLGPALTFGLVVAGQMVASVVLDHFNILTAQPHPISLGRLAGIALLVIGVILIRKY